MGKIGKNAADFLKIVVGAALYALGFDLFLVPNGINGGGITGLSMIFVNLTNVGTIGLITAILNLPLFILAGLKIGKKFFVGSLLGMAVSSGLIDLFELITQPATEPLVGALYGGAVCGFGLGLVFAAGGSTGGSDIIVRFFKRKWPNTNIGTIAMCFDFLVAALTGLVFRDITLTLYSGIVIFITGFVIDAVVYRFDYSKVALIISKEYDAIAAAVCDELGHGVTYLQGEGYYTQNSTKVVLTAIKRQQLAELKQLVMRIDPNAFVIVQEAHQVLGDGFSRYSKDSL
ncbi:MAG: YitT family protein [Oscillospiraceae bacterium]|nr:YitT family protein [Oscillospiraceae bacterium]